LRLSTWIRSNGCSPAPPSATVRYLPAVTWYPAPRQPFSTTQRRPSSSSAMRMRPSAMLAILSRDGQEAGHRRPASRLARDLDGAPVLVGDAMAEGQPQSQPPLRGREEGREELGPRLLGNTCALVGDLDLRHAPLSLAEIHLGEERVHAQPRDE